MPAPKKNVPQNVKVYNGEVVKPALIGGYKSGKGVIGAIYPNGNVVYDSNNKIVTYKSIQG